MFRRGGREEPVLEGPDVLEPSSERRKGTFRREGCLIVCELQIVDSAGDARLWLNEGPKWQRHTVPFTATLVNRGILWFFQSIG